MRQRRRSLLSSAVLAICVSGPAAAADPLGLYVGGSIGQAQIAAQVSDPFIALSDRFKKNHSAFKVMVGLRPISPLGASGFASAQMHCIIENLFEDGQWAILEWRDPSGLRGCGFFHVVHGQITFQRGYWDKLSFLRLHGLPLPDRP